MAGAFQALEIKSGPFDPALLRQVRETLITLHESGATSHEGNRRIVPIALLKPGCVLLSDIRTMQNHLVLAAGERLSPAQVALLQN